MTDFSDEIDIEIRPAGELMARLSLLLGTSRRVTFEDLAAESTAEEQYAIETDRFELYEWVRKSIPGIPTAGELEHLQFPLGELPEELADEHATDAEAALAIGWVLGLVPNLTFEVPATSETEKLENAAPRPWDRLDKLAKRIRIKDEAEVWAERERWYLVYLRGLIEDAGNPAAVLEDIVSDASAAGHPTRNADLLIGRQSYATLDSDFKLVLNGTAESYVKALTWACGLGLSWDGVPIDDV